MYIAKMILAFICIALSVCAVICFLKSRRILKNQNPDDRDAVLTQVEKLLKTLEVLIYLLITSSAVFSIISIVEGITG